MIIKSAAIKKILNSEGAWTIEASLESNTHQVSASVPKGKSAGETEAFNQSIETVLKNFSTTKEKILGKNFDSSREFDEYLLALDGTKNKTNLGANLILSLSIAFLKLHSKEKNIEPYQYIASEFNFTPSIPQFFLLIFEGGKHGSKYLTSQEFMLVENNINNAQSIISSYKRYLVENGQFVGFGLEGAFTSAKMTDIDVLNLMRILTPQKKIALDIAESSRTGDALDFKNILENYNIFSIEDPKHETDYKGWSKFYEDFGNKILVVADDLTTTNKTLIQNAQQEKMANSVIIKPNQVRSQRTLQLAMGERAYTPITDWRLKERNYGDLNGTSKEELLKKDPTMAVLYRRSWNYPPPGGESIEMVYYRVMSFIKELTYVLKKEQASAALSVSNNSMRPIRAYFENLDKKKITTLNNPTGKDYCLYNV